MTTKTSLTIYFICGFLMLLALCSSLVFLSQRNFLLSSTRKTLDIFSHEFRYEYMCMAEEPVGAITFPTNNLPPKCKLAISNEHPRFVPECVYLIQQERRFFIAGYIEKETSLLIWDDRKEIISSFQTLPDDDRRQFINSEFNEESYGKDNNEIMLLLLTPEGEITAYSTFDDSHMYAFKHFVAQKKNTEGYHHIDVDDHGILLLCHNMFDGNQLVIASSLESQEQNQRHLLLIFAFVFLGSIPLGLIMGIYVAKKYSHDLEVISKAANEVQTGNYETRIRYTGKWKETNDVISSFNRMTSATSKLLKELKSLTDDIAHDLKTPITRMKVAAEMQLYKGEDLDFAGKIAENCDEMVSMIDASLEITRTEQDIGNSTPTDVSVTKLILKLQEAFSTLIEDHGQSLNLNLPKEDIVIKGKAKHLERMMANLLDNAIKYTPAGGNIGISAFIVNTGNSLEIKVADTGYGIAEKDLPFIFNRFYRAEASRTSQGHGLGLCMVKAIVEKMNGTINVKSVPGKGTTFTVTLPRNSEKCP